VQKIGDTLVVNDHAVGHVELVVRLVQYDKGKRTTRLVQWRKMDKG
jgi:hypothetical protein